MRRIYPPGIGWFLLSLSVRAADGTAYVVNKLRGPCNPPYVRRFFARGFILSVGRLYRRIAFASQADAGANDCFQAYAGANDGGGPLRVKRGRHNPKYSIAGSLASHVSVGL